MVGQARCWGWGRVRTADLVREQCKGRILWGGGHAIIRGGEERISRRRRRCTFVDSCTVALDGHAGRVNHLAKRAQSISHRIVE